MRVWFEVRIREVVGGVDVKKSKFYMANNSHEAAKCYKGPWHIMSVTKVGKDTSEANEKELSGKLLGLGGFLKLGDDLLSELRRMDKAKEK